MRWIYVSLICLLLASPVEARRISRPDVYKLPWSDEQITNLNNIQEDIFQMQKGRYESDIVSTTKSSPNNGEMWITTGIVAGVALTGQIAEVNYRTGDENFVLSPAVYGEIWYMGSGFATTCTLKDVYYQVAGFAVNGRYSQTTPDHANDHIEIAVAGDYLINFSISARAAIADHYQFMIKHNNGTLDCTNIMVHRDISSAARVGTGACSGVCSLKATDTVELWVRNVDTAGRDIDIEHATLSVVRIGP